MDKLPLNQHSMLPEITPAGELAQQAELTDFLNRFEDPIVLSNALLVQHWTADEEINQLIALAKQNDDLKLKIPAIRELRERRLAMRGSPITATRTRRMEDGSTVSLTTEVVAQSLRKEPINVSKETQTNPEEILPILPLAPPSKEERPQQPSSEDYTEKKDVPTRINKPASFDSDLQRGLAGSPERP